MIEMCQFLWLFLRATMSFIEVIQKVLFDSDGTLYKFVWLVKLTVAHGVINGGHVEIFPP